MSRIAIIVAMEGEVRPLIRRWKFRTIERDGRKYRLFENGNAVLICGGIGGEAARRATEVVIGEINPARVVSAGFAGALDASLQVGDVLEPRAVINAADGVRTEIGVGAGILVTSKTVADKEQKIRFSVAYGAQAVDMEAASVSQGAHAREVEFGVVKAISDAADFHLPALEEFVTSDGNFSSVRFACHVVLRPWLWATTIALARNSFKASQALCGALEGYIARSGAGAQTLRKASLSAALNRTEVGPESASGPTHTGIEAHTEGKR
ncbi:MAG: hypothetical protein WBW53_13365 [Terriglobales bacterium]